MPIRNTVFYAEARKPNVDRYWLLVLDIGGIQKCYAETELDVWSRDEGRYYHFVSALRLQETPGYTLQVTPDSKSVTPRNISCSIDGSENLHQYRFDPYSKAITYSTAYLRMWCAGLDWEDAYVFDGIIDDIEWGNPGENFKFTIKAFEPYIDKDFPELTIDRWKWPSARDYHIGFKYNTVFGQYDFVPCWCVDNTIHRFLVTGHSNYYFPSALSDSAGLFALYKSGVKMSYGASNDYISWADYAALHPGLDPVDRDGHGNKVTTVVLTEDPEDNQITAKVRGIYSFEPFGTRIERYWINDFPSMMYYLIVWYSQLESLVGLDAIDKPSFEYCAHVLHDVIGGWYDPAAINISSLFNGHGSDAATVINTINNRICRQVPMACYWREGKYKAIPVTYQRLDYQVIGELHTSKNIIKRVAGPKFENMENVFNAFTVKYEYDATVDTEGCYYGYIIWDPLYTAKDTASDPRLRSDNLSALSFKKYGRRLPPEGKPLFAPDCQFQTALNLAISFIHWFHNQQFTVSYKCSPDAYKYQVGGWVEVTDEYLGWTKKKFLILEDAPDIDGTTLTLRSAEYVSGESSMEEI